MSATSYIEKMIAKKFVEDTLAKGFSISVNDGEETVFRRSRIASEILDAMRTTDEDYLLIHEESGAQVGWVNFVYSNGTDVICDYTDNETTRACVAGAEALTAKIENA